MPYCFDFTFNFYFWLMSFKKRKTRRRKKKIDRKKEDPVETLARTFCECRLGGPAPQELVSGFGWQAGRRAGVPSEPRAGFPWVSLALPPRPLLAAGFLAPAGAAARFGRGWRG